MSQCFGSLCLEGRRSTFRYPGGKRVWFGQVITAEDKPLHRLCMHSRFLRNDNTALKHSRVHTWESGWGESSTEQERGQQEVWRGDTGICSEKFLSCSVQNCAANSTRWGFAGFLRWWFKLKEAWQCKRTEQPKCSTMEKCKTPQCKVF